MTETTAPMMQEQLGKAENRVWKKFRSHRSALLGGILVSFFVLIAVLAPILPIPDPAATSWSAVRKAPSMAHWMGTDEIGRDVMARLIWGAQASLLAGVVSVGIAMCRKIKILKLVEPLLTQKSRGQDVFHRLGFASCRCRA